MFVVWICRIGYCFRESRDHQCNSAMTCDDDASKIMTGLYIYYAVVTPLRSPRSRLAMVTVYRSLPRTYSPMLRVSMSVFFFSPALSRYKK